MKTNTETNNQPGTVQNESDNHQIELVGSEPRFERLPVSYDDLDCSQMSSAPPSGPYCVQVFNEFKENSDHSFRTTKEVPLYAGVRGVVIVVDYQEQSDDYAVHIIPGAESYDGQTQSYQYIVEYDHFWDPKIKVGDVIEPDTLIGSVACGDAHRGDPCSYYRVELQVNKADNPKGPGPQPSNIVCGYKYFVSNLQSELDRFIQKHNAAFPNYAHEQWCTGEKIPA